MKNNKGYLLIETIVAVGISIIVIGCGMLFLFISIKSCCESETKMELNYNCKETANKIASEIRDSYGVEIIDSNNGWVKVYKSEDKTQFISFRIKKNKLFVGYGNTLNSNSEFSNYLKTFKVTYLPNGVDNPEQARGVNIFMEFEKNKDTIKVSTSAAFRCKY